MNQPLDIEVQVLKAKVESLEFQMKWVNKNWIEWTSSTKDMGQKLMISLDQIVNKKEV